MSKQPELDIVQQAVSRLSAEQGGDARAIFTKAMKAHRGAAMRLSRGDRVKVNDDLGTYFRSKKTSPFANRKIPDYVETYCNGKLPASVPMKPRVVHDVADTRPHHRPRLSISRQARASA